MHDKVTYACIFYFSFREEDDLYNGDADAEDPKDGDKKRKKKVGEAMTKGS